MNKTMMFEPFYPAVSGRDNDLRERHPITGRSYVAALSFVNQIRKRNGQGALSELPTGVSADGIETVYEEQTHHRRQMSDCCAIAEGIGRGATVGRRVMQLEGKFYELPTEVEQFIRAFDDGGKGDAIRPLDLVFEVAKEQELVEFAEEAAIGAAEERRCLEEVSAEESRQSSQGLVLS